jgi:hypothetical protein
LKPGEVKYTSADIPNGFVLNTSTGLISGSSTVGVDKDITIVASSPLYPGLSVSYKFKFIIVDGIVLSSNENITNFYDMQSATSD